MRVEIPIEEALAGFTKLHDGRSYGYSMTGPKWRCNTCHRTGYGTGSTPWHQNWRGDAITNWSVACLRGHSPCPWCGRQLTLRMDGTPRVHARCPERPADVELLRVIGEEVKAEVRLSIRGPLNKQGEALLARLAPTGDDT